MTYVTLAGLANGSGNSLGPQKRAFPGHAEIQPDDNKQLEAASYTLVAQMRAVATERCGLPAGNVGPTVSHQLADILAMIIGIPRVEVHSVVSMHRLQHVDGYPPAVGLVVARVLQPLGARTWVQLGRAGSNTHTSGDRSPAYFDVISPAYKTTFLVAGS